MTSVRELAESLTRPLRRGAERRLKALSAELWPYDEYEREP